MDARLEELRAYVTSASERRREEARAIIDEGVESRRRREALVIRAFELAYQGGSKRAMQAVRSAERRCRADGDAAGLRVCKRIARLLKMQEEQGGKPQ